MWQKYFAGVRWGEVIVALLISILTDLQAKSLQGQPLTQAALCEMAVNALKMIVAYLRVPKSPDVVADESSAPLNLPPKADPSAAVIAALVAQGKSRTMAAAMVAADFEEAAQIAKGGE